MIHIFPEDKTYTTQLLLQTWSRLVVVSTKLFGRVLVVTAGEGKNGALPKGPLIYEIFCAFWKM
jgi:hypothetical protein